MVPLTTFISRDADRLLGPSSDVADKLQIHDTTGTMS
jgi:copper(I)-binding protein